MSNIIKIEELSNLFDIESQTLYHGDNIPKDIYHNDKYIATQVKISNYRKLSLLGMVMIVITLLISIGFNNIEIYIMFAPIFGIIVILSILLVICDKYRVRKKIESEIHNIKK